MFSGTLVLPHADGDITVTKINQDNYSSEYLAKAALSETRVRIRHTKSKAPNGDPMERHNVEILTTVYATESEAAFIRKDYIVIERKPGDMDVKQTDALADWLIATANANVTSLLGWES